MPAHDETTQILLENECWRLLREHEVGRLAVAIGDRPEIFPINYAVDHGTIVFRTSEGTKLVAVVAQSLVAFEIDGEQADEAWSVVVKGRAAEIEERLELFDAIDLPLYSWHSSPKHRFVRIVPDQVTGRRFVVADRAGDHADDPIPHHSPPE